MQKVASKASKHTALPRLLHISLMCKSTDVEGPIRLMCKRLGRAICLLALLASLMCSSTSVAGPAGTVYFHPPPLTRLDGSSTSVAHREHHTGKSKSSTATSKICVPPEFTFFFSGDTQFFSFCVLQNQNSATSKFVCRQNFDSGAHNYTWESQSEFSKHLAAPLSRRMSQSRSLAMLKICEDMYTAGA